MQFMSAAAAEGNEAVVKYFLVRGADVDATYYHGNYLERGGGFMGGWRERKA